jgi:hypothetical protein
MLEHAATPPNVCERRRKASFVLSAPMAPSRLDKPSESTPPSTRRMRDDGQISVVGARIAALIPWIDASDTEVGSTFRHKQGSYVHRLKISRRHVITRPH